MSSASLWYFTILGIKVMGPYLSLKHCWQIQDEMLRTRQYTMEQLSPCRNRFELQETRKEGV